jgi:hypothetical protein
MTLHTPDLPVWPTCSPGMGQSAVIGQPVKEFGCDQAIPAPRNPSRSMNRSAYFQTERPRSFGKRFSAALAAAFSAIAAARRTIQARASIRVYCSKWTERVAWSVTYQGERRRFRFATTRIFLDSLSRPQLGREFMRQLP